VTPFPSVEKRKALAGLRVLVVDDNETNRRILDEMLASWRMMPTTVADAQSALDALRRQAGSRQRFDVVISDGQMPGVDGFTLARRIKRERLLSTIPVVMLTSMGDPRDVARCRKIGVNAYLTKPVKHSDLLDALVTVFGVSTRHKPSAVPPPRTRTALRVLVAEDNLVNRKLVTRLLQKRGHRITAVENGRLAVAALQSGKPRFDIVLMDVQMPEMNGLEATAAIRRHEAERGGHIPIIALTAHAMQGDRERCLAAGMDGYLAKPIDVDELISTLESSVTAGQASAPPAQAAEAAGPRAQVFDERAAMSHASGDRRLLSEVIGFFRADYPKSLRRMALAVTRQDAEALRLHAHALKGALATVGSPASRDAAFALEQLGRSGDLTGASDRLAELRTLIASLEKALHDAGFAPRQPRRRTTASTTTPKRKARKSHGKSSRR
jgi:two-component system sensor histidine kinase/response regulator